MWRPLGFSEADGAVEDTHRQLAHAVQLAGPAGQHDAAAGGGLDGGGVLQGMNRDLADGRHMRFGNIGFQYENTASDWTISLKTGYTKGRNTFDALYSTTNPVDARSFANGYLGAARSTFGQRARGRRSDGPRASNACGQQHCRPNSGQHAHRQA